MSCCFLLRFYPFPLDIVCWQWDWPHLPSPIKTSELCALPPPSVIWQVNVPSFSSVKWSMMNSMIPLETSCPILLGCRKTQLHCKRGHTYLMTDFVNINIFFALIMAFMLQQSNNWDSMGLLDREAVHLEARQYIFYLFYDFQFVNAEWLLHQLLIVPCYLQRICRWLWRISPQPAAKISFCLSPKSYRPTQTSVGWLEERIGEKTKGG